MYAEKIIYILESGINNGYSYAPYVNLLIMWGSIVLTDTRPARGNTRTKLGNMDRLLGLILAQILFLALPLAGLKCLSNNDASARNKHIHVGIVYLY